ncbi:hypothetical protein ACHAW6_007040 [Cyclotella cf. meneghiniana]
MKLKLCNLAATVTSSAAAIQSANDTAPGAIISSLIFVKYIVPIINLTELGDHSDSYTGPVVKTTEAAIENKLSSSLIHKICPIPTSLAHFSIVSDNDVFPVVLNPPIVSFGKSSCNLGCPSSTKQPFGPVTRAADDPRLPVYEVRPMQECMPTVQPLPAWHDEIELWPLPKYSAFDLSLGPDGIFVADRMNFLSPLSNELDAKSHFNGESSSVQDGKGSFPSTSFIKSAIKIGRSSCVSIPSGNDNKSIAPEDPTFIKFENCAVAMFDKIKSKSFEVTLSSFFSESSGDHEVWSIRNYSWNKLLLAAKGTLFPDGKGSFLTNSFCALLSKIGLFFTGSLPQSEEVLVPSWSASVEVRELSHMLHYMSFQSSLAVEGILLEDHLSFTKTAFTRPNGKFLWHVLCLLIIVVLLVAMTMLIGNPFLDGCCLRCVWPRTNLRSRLVYVILLLPTFSYVVALPPDSKKEDWALIKNEPNKSRFPVQDDERIEGVVNYNPSSNEHVVLDDQFGNEKYFNISTGDFTNNKQENLPSLFHAQIAERNLAVASRATTTLISDTVIVDTVTFTSDDSPVFVEGMLDISSGGILIIDAGTTIVFESLNSGINVKSGGQLLITGNLNNRVTLKTSEQNEAWKGISFEAGSAAAVFDSGLNFISGSVIQYADIIRAGYSSSYQSSQGISLHDGVCPYLLGVNMIDCGGYYFGSAISIQSLSGIFLARNLRVLKSNQTEFYYPQYAIAVSGNYANVGQVILDNANFEVDVSYYSLYVYGINQVVLTRSLIFKEVYFYYLTEAAVNWCTLLSKLELHSIGDDSKGKIDVTHNFINNGVDISYLRSSSVSSLVSSNLIKNGRLYFYTYFNSVSITISENVVQKSSNGGIYIYNSNGLVSAFNNTFESCSSSWYPIVQLSSSTNTFSFKNNKILNNEAIYVVYLEGVSYVQATSDFSENVAVGNTATNSLIFLSSYPWSSFTRNIFDNNTAPFSVETYMPSYSGILKLPFNFWGGFQADIIDLRRTVVDGFVRGSQPIADFDPVLSGPFIQR